MTMVLGIIQYNIYNNQSGLKCNKMFAIISLGMEELHGHRHL